MRAHSPSIALLAGLLLAGGCARPSADRNPVELTVAIDLDPDPDVVEIELVAAVGTKEYLDGKPAEVWGYRDGGRNGSKVTVPGPLIETKQGDLLVVRVRNELPEATTVHWHGLRLPIAQDGTNTAQLPIMSGETFEYRFVVNDPGSYWYHPHMRSDVQIENGLYAPLIVRGGIEPEVAADRYFVLDDVKLDGDGTLVDAPTALDLMVGRQGNVVLVNGVRGASIDVASGSRERWRFVNAANGRFFNLSLPGVSFLVIGWDGGVIAEPYSVDTLLIAPGERYEVLVELDVAAGASVTLQTLFYDRGHSLPDPGPIDLLRLDVGKSGLAPPALPTVWADVPPIAVTTSSAVRAFVLTEIEDTGNGQPMFMINGEAWPFNNPISADLGATEIWEIRNDAEMDHPFHLHGMFFQVLDRDGVPETRLGWKDTVLVPQLSTVRFAVTYTAPGMWMYHCHILEHAELGMMGTLMVGPMSMAASGGHAH